MQDAKSIVKRIMEYNNKIMSVIRKRYKQTRHVG